MVEADVSARLLGLTVLRLRADVLLVPAQVQAHPVVAGAVIPSRPAGVRQAPRDRADGTVALAEAIRLLTESGRTLDQLGHNAPGSSTRRRRR